MRAHQLDGNTMKHYTVIFTDASVQDVPIAGQRNHSYRLLK